jgi:hypothetical protein
MGRLALSRCRPVAGGRLRVDTWTVLYYWIFLYFFKRFWSSSLHLEVLNVPILMEIGDFTFFQLFLYFNLEYTWTFISTVGIFISWKIEITKYSSRFASVMEIFCTLLQCRVDLSMFHSSSTSKIWHTST